MTVVRIFLTIIFSFFTLIVGLFFINFFAQADALPDVGFIDGSNCSDRSDGRLQINCEDSTLPTPDLIGNEEDDTIYGKFGLDRLYGKEGNDILDGGENDDELYGDDGNDNLYGSLGDDFLFGGKDNDVLVGYIGDDYISGDKGSDELYGDMGNDVLKGGPGADYFDCGQDRDTVIDYKRKEGDIISQSCESIMNKGV